MAFVEYSHDLTALVSSAKHKSFATDGWCDRLKRELEGSSVSFISEDWKLVQLVVDFQQIQARNRDAKTKAGFFEKLFHRYVVTPL
jgi:hypothetical protein